MNFFTVYAHAVEYQLKVQEYTRLLLDTFANQLITAVSHDYGIDQCKLAAKAKAVMDAFVINPDEQIPQCKAVTYRGKPCHKRAHPDYEGYCEIHPPKKSKAESAPSSSKPNKRQGEDLMRVAKMLRVL